MVSANHVELLDLQRANLFPNLDGIQEIDETNAMPTVAAPNPKSALRVVPA